MTIDHQHYPIDTLVRMDHDKIFSLYSIYTGSSDLDEKQKIANTIIREVSIHSAAEEVVLYPAYEKHLLQSGNQIADSSRSEHLQVKNEMYELDKLKVTDSSFDSILSKIIQDLHEHIEHEEEYLTMLRQAVSEDILKSLARSFETAKIAAPTHPHPSAPDTPAMEAIAGAAMKPMDKLRDSTRNFAECGK